MPPVMGAAAFLIAEFLQISYWQVCIAAFLPGVAFYATLLLQVDLRAAKTGLTGLPRESLPSLGKTLAGGWQYLLPFALLIFLLGGLRYSAQTSIMYTLGALILVGAFKKKSRLTIEKLLAALEDSARGMMPIIPLCTVIGILVGSIEMTGAGTKFTSELLSISGGNLFLLLALTAVAAFILGMGMTAVSVYILTVVLIAPAIVRAGVEPIAAHLFLFYFGCLSFITTTGVRGRVHSRRYIRWGSMEDRVSRGEARTGCVPGALGLCIQSGHSNDWIPDPDHWNVFFRSIGYHVHWGLFRRVSFHQIACVGDCFYGDRRFSRIRSQCDHPDNRNVFSGSCTSAAVCADPWKKDAS